MPEISSNRWTKILISTVRMYLSHDIFHDVQYIIAAPSNKLGEI